VHPSLRGLGEYVVAAVDAKRGNEPGALAWASGKLLASRDFVQLCLSRNPLCFKFLPAEFKGEELGSATRAVPSTVQRARRLDRFEAMNPPFSPFLIYLFLCLLLYRDRGLGDGDVDGHVSGGGGQALGAARGRPAAALAQPEETVCRPRRHAPWALPNKALPLPRLMQHGGFWLLVGSAGLELEQLEHTSKQRAPNRAGRPFRALRYVPRGVSLDLTCKQRTAPLIRFGVWFDI
jgi:hypothetical protein